MQEQQRHTQLEPQQLQKQQVLQSQELQQEQQQHQERQQQQQPQLQQLQQQLQELQEQQQQQQQQLSSQPPPPPVPFFVGTLPVQYGPIGQGIICPNCQNQVMTRVGAKISTKTHLVAAALCLLGCWPCFYIPYCSDGCKTKNHYCPSCGIFLGSYAG